MKPVCCLLVFGLFCNLSFSQDKVRKSSHYLFPEFTRGVVLMISGERNEALLNYNAYTEEMVFEEKGKKYAIARNGVGLIDTVFLRDRKFITMNDQFFELLYDSVCDLYAGHKCKVNSSAKPDGFRSTSQTSAVTSSSTYKRGFNREQGNTEEMNVPESFYELILPDGYEPEPYTWYWLNKNGELNLFISLKQLMKIYADKEKLFKAYVKTQKVKIDNQESVVQLIKYLEAN